MSIKPDVHTFRFREKYMSILTSRTHKAFLKEFPQYKRLSLADFKVIIKTYNKHLVQAVADNRHGIELLNGIGSIFIATCPPPKTRVIDFNKSIDHGVIAAHKNWDSDNNLMKIFYTNYKNKPTLPNKQLWAFRASKPVRKILSSAYRKNWMFYQKADPKKKISAEFDAFRRKEYGAQSKTVVDSNYDEFNL